MDIEELPVDFRHPLIMPGQIYGDDPARTTRTRNQPVLQDPSEFLPYLETVDEMNLLIPGKGDELKKVIENGYNTEKRFYRLRGISPLSERLEQEIKRLYEMLQAIIGLVQGMKLEHYFKHPEKRKSLPYDNTKQADKCTSTRS